MNQERRTDIDIVTLVKSGDKQAFAVLYRMYSPALYGVILKIVNDEAIAQDILQDTFLKIWEKIHTYDSSKGTIFTWMLNLARNKAIDVGRLKYEKNKIRIDDLNVDIETEHSGKASDAIGTRTMVERLPDDYKVLIDLVYFGGRTQQEVSVELNLPLGTVKTRTRKALQLLREAIKERS